MEAFIFVAGVFVGWVAGVIGMVLQTNVKRRQGITEYEEGRQDGEARFAEYLRKKGIRIP